LFTPSTTQNPINVGADNVLFTAEELQKFENITSRLAVINTDPNFPNDSRTLQWLSMRNSTSHDYYQNRWSTWASGKVKEQTVNGKQ
jgi:hypothetical protein